jgi:hypothetical protein
MLERIRQSGKEEEKVVIGRSPPSKNQVFPQDQELV